MSSPPSDVPGASGLPPATAAPQQIVVQSPPPTALGRYGKYLLLALGLCVMGLIGQAASYRSYFSPPGGPQEKFHSLEGAAEKKIAIIKVAGTILEGDGFVKQQIDRVGEDDSVVAVVVRIDSPGGTVTGSDYIYHHLRRLAGRPGDPQRLSDEDDDDDDGRKLPLVVSMGSMCASGGYYIAMAVGDQPDSIFAEPTTWTGSIGVVIPHYDLSGLLSQWNVKDDSVASHKYKLMGSPTRELSPEERAEERELLQGLVDRSFERFKAIVLSGRPKFRDNPDQVGEIATGQIFTAQQALDRGLVDRIGFIDQAVERAAELAGHDPEKLRCVKYEEPPTTLSTLLAAEGSASAPPRQFDLARLLDLTAPRAYYLCTWLPSLLSPR